MLTAEGGNTLNPTVLFVGDANRADFRVSPRVDYLLGGALTLSVGTDIFATWRF